MSQTLLRRLLFIFLVCLLQTRAETVPKEDINTPRVLNNYSLNTEREAANSNERIFSIDESSIKLPNASQEDHDPAESSETIVYNRFENPADHEEKESSSEEDPEGPPDHVIPYSEHESPNVVSTKPKYTAPGEWAKPSKGRTTSSDEVPSKVYAQVRRTHTVRRLPRKRAFENAESEEEKANAGRLKEVVRNSKVNTVYTEEGYEDSAYDHAGHIRDADFDEGYARKVHQQVDSKKKSGEGENHDKDSRKSKEYEKINAEEFKDYDEDYKDHHETSTNYRSLTDGDEDDWTRSSYPKLVVQNGVRRLQDDLDREAVEIEKGVEISKLEYTGGSSDGESFNESRRKDDYRRKSEDKRKNGKEQSPTWEESDEDNEDDEQLKNTRKDISIEDYSTWRTLEDRDEVTEENETTTSANNIGNLTTGPLEAYKYEVEENSPTQSEIIDFQRTDEDPSTVSYSQLFWDYFKNSNQFTTINPFSIEPNALRPSSSVANNFVTYPPYLEPLTTPFPIIESAILSPQKLVSSQGINPVYPEVNQRNQITEVPNRPATDEPRHSVPNIANDLVDSIRNLDSREESNFASSNPMSFTNRKPRYKITMRHKPVIPLKPSAPNPTNEPVIESTTIVNNILNVNYIKMLTHLRNEEGIKNSQNPLQNNNFYLSNIESLRRMRPPAPQKETPYQNFIPLELSQNIAVQSWNPGPYNTVKFGSTAIRASSAPLTRKRSPIPANGLLPPARLLNADYTRRKETAVYQMYGGTKPKRARNVPRSAFRLAVGPEAVNGARAKRRERRSLGWESGDETGGTVKATKLSASNAASNRGEIERPAKNPTAERNPRRKVTRGMEVGLVPDTAGSTLVGFDGGPRGTDRGEGSRGSVVGGAAIGEGESVSYGGLIDDGEENRKVSSDFDTLKDDGDGKMAGIEGESKRNESAEERKFEVDLERDGKMLKSLKQGNEATGNFEYNMGIFGLDYGRVKGGLSEGLKNKDGNEGKEYGSVEGNFALDEMGNGRKEAFGGSVRQKRDLRGSMSEIGVEYENEKHLENQRKDEGKSVSKEYSRRKRDHSDVDRESNSESVKSEEKKDSNENMESSVGSLTYLDENEARETDEESAKHKGNIHEHELKAKSHEDLLNESPKITEDVIDKEINSRFTENEDEEDDDYEEEGERKVEVEVPEITDIEYVEEIPEEENADIITTTEATIDVEKYPFYNEQLPSPSALKYAMDPRRVPKKTYGRMNFYDSRDSYRHCDEVEPNLDVLPEEAEPIPEKGVNENPQRLKGLGDKLDCFKAKYFDENPFDNPLFLEDEVEDPLAPLEVDHKQFASRIMLFPKEDDENVVQKSSKRPENHRYHHHRKLESSTTRTPKSRRTRIKSYPRGVSRSRHRVVRIKGKNVRYVRPRRPQKTIRRPITSASEVSSMYTPYQNQVYEDVMGTIKNMANSYQVEEITTVPTSEEDDTSEESEEKTNMSENSTKAGKKEKDKTLMSSKEHLSNSGVNAEKKPPRKYNRHRMSYKRVRVPQKNRRRVQILQMKANRLVPIAHRHRIIRYKRSKRSEEDVDKSIDASAEFSSIEVADSGEKDEEIIGKQEIKNFTSVSDSEEILRKKDSVEKDLNFNSSSKTIEAKRKSKVPKIVSRSLTTDENQGKKPTKVIYTINDRIRHSKPKAEVTRTGKFTNESEIVVDHRRKEPRYNYIRREKTVPVSSTTELPYIRQEKFVPVSSTTELSLIISTESSVDAGTDSSIAVGSDEVMKENMNTQYFVNNTDGEKLNQSEAIDEFNQSSVELPTEANSNKSANSYAVHEAIKEDLTTTQGPPEISILKSYFEPSPSLAEFSSEEYRKAFFSKNNSKDFSSPYNSSVSKESLEKVDDFSNTHRSRFSNEESSGKLKSAKTEPSTESSEEGGASKDSDSKEDRTFLHYWSRPTSPAENYEDDKYKDLGRRVNKPAFFHPPFSSLTSRKSLFSSSEEDSGETEEAEEKDEYVFPWHRDKIDKKKRKKRNRSRDKLIDEYEYPWDRRERLAREEKRNKKGKHTRLDFDDEYNADDVPSTKSRRNVYPRGRIRFWTRKDENSSEENKSDNVESSSETRPVKKYSSRYSMKNVKLPADASSSSIKSRSVKEISKSIKEALERDSMEQSIESSEEKVAQSSRISKGIVPEDVTMTPRRNGGKEVDKISLNDTTDVKNKNSSVTLNNTLENGESRLTVTKTIPQEILNSTKELNSTLQLNKRRRRPMKNASNVESTTKIDVNRGRRRQKVAATSPTSISSTSTTSAPRVVRRNSTKLNNTGKKVNSKIGNKLDTDDPKEAETSMRNRTVEHRVNAYEESNSGRKSRIDKEKNETKKNIKDRGRKAKKQGRNRTEELNEEKSSEEKKGRSQNLEKEAFGNRGNLGHYDADDSEETHKETKEVTTVRYDGGFDFLDDRIEALSDFVKSDDTHDNLDEFGFEGSIVPHNRAAQLSQQESREFITTKSWISENYNF